MKIKGNLSLNKLMHNDRLMIFLSLVAAIVIWAAIVNGPGNEETRTLAVPVSVELTNQIAGENGLRVIDTTGKVPTVDVTVRGQRWQLVGLSRDDLIARANTESVLTPGEKQVQVSVRKKDPTSNFEIVQQDYGQIYIYCDYWVTNKTFSLNASAPKVILTDTEKYRFGNPTVDAESQIVTVSGPKTILDKITELRAVVDAEEAVANSQTYTAQIRAFDAAGNEVEGLTQCEMSTKTTTVTVQVLEHRRVEFKYTVNNAPASLQTNPNFVTLSPAYIELWAPRDTIDQTVQSIEDLGVFDFDNMTTNDNDQIVELNIPPNAIVDNGVKAVEVHFDMNGYASANFNLTLTTSSISSKLITILNPPEGKELSIPQITLTGITIYGPTKAVSALKASDLLVEVDMEGTEATGPSLYKARVKVKNRTDTWTYYGEEGQHGYDLYITVK